MPLFWILLVAAALRIVAITWGLPASDSWDDDGIAPRDIFVGVIMTYAPDSYYIYPPLHFVLLSLLTWPGAVAALLSSHSLRQADVIASFIQIPYMTFFSLVARSVSVLMSLATIVVIGKTAEHIGGRRAGYCAAGVCALSATLVYYGHVTNLDGPYLFWCSLSILCWVSVIAERDLRQIRWGAIFAVAAIATKDQAYAVFLLSLPLAFVLWFALDRWPRQNARRLFTTLAFWLVISLIALLLIDGAITNPVGFARRIDFLTGPASQGYSFYQDTWFGRFHLIDDLWNHFPWSYPLAATTFGLAGVAICVVNVSENRSKWVAGLLPLLVIISFTVAFNFVVLRSENRFVLPQWLYVAVYIGIAVDKLAFATDRTVRYATRLILVPLAVFALYESAAVDAAFLADPRYDAEQWLRSNLKPGDTLEIYGQNCYLPRLPDGVVATRVDSKPLTPRNPQIHVTEISQPFEAVARRNPRFILVPATWIRTYLLQIHDPLPAGRVYSTRQQATFKKTAARAYFLALSEGRAGYRLVHESVYRPVFWPEVHIHESLGETIRIYERIAVPTQSPGRGQI